MCSRPVRAQIDPEIKVIAISSGIVRAQTVPDLRLFVMSAI